MKINEFKLKCLMGDRGINSVQLAESTGISRNTISCVVNGKSCSLTTASKIAQALNVGVADIAEE